nr:MAG TPA: DNA-directed RNA polymerase [Caudoviricetes sp.]
MAEYIEREALKTRFAKRLVWLKRDIHNEYSLGLYDGCEYDAGLIDEIPSADVAPVVRGRWEREPASYWRWTPSGAVAVTRTTYRCGLCGRGTAVKFNYCPNCGAKMDGGDNHETD